jgi:hypothetical protein
MCSDILWPEFEDKYYFSFIFYEPNKDTRILLTGKRKKKLSVVSQKN